MTREKVTAADYVPAYYEYLYRRYKEGSWWSRDRLRNVLELAHLAPGQRLLDLGCGWGTFTLAGILQGGHAVAMDYAKPALQATRRLFFDHGLPSPPLVQADAGKLPFKAASFDTVIAADVLEHLYPQTFQGMMGECFRVLRPGGSLILYTPLASHLFEHCRQMIPRPLWRFSREFAHQHLHVDLKSPGLIMKEVGEAGFEIEASHFRPSHLPFFQPLERRLMNWPLIGPLFRRRFCLRARKPVGR